MGFDFYNVFLLQLHLVRVELGYGQCFPYKRFDCGFKFLKFVHHLVKNEKESTNTIATLPLPVFIAIFVLFHLTTKITFKYQIYYSFEP